MSNGRLKNFMGHQKTGTDFVPYYTDFTEIGEVFQTTYQGAGSTAPIFLTPKFTGL